MSPTLWRITLDNLLAGEDLPYAAQGQIDYIANGLGNLFGGSKTNAPAGTNQPSAAFAILTYKDAITGNPAESTVALAVDANNIWSGTWDSLLAQAGNIDWRIQAKGSLQAAAQGTFTLLANTANTEPLDP